MKKDFFRLQEHGTTAKREVLAGITTFMTMAYVLAVQPAAICGFGPDPVFTDVNGLVISKSALLVMCALVSGAITLFMGLYANLPLALSTAMGSNFILGGLVNSGAFSFGLGHGASSLLGHTVYSGDGARRSENGCRSSAEESEDRPFRRRSASSLRTSALRTPVWLFFQTVWRSEISLSLRFSLR